MSDDTVKARYMGNPAMLRLDDGGEDVGEEIELKPRHVYDLPKSVVADRDDFIIQTDEESEKAVDSSAEKRKER
jgi:hypothetical protein